MKLWEFEIIRGSQFKRELRYRGIGLERRTIDDGIHTFRPNFIGTPSNNHERLNTVFGTKLWEGEFLEYNISGMKLYKIGKKMSRFNFTIGELRSYDMKQSKK